MRTSSLEVRRNKVELEKRRRAFRLRLNFFAKKYDGDLIEDFFLYWGEADRSYKEMRFEKEPTWELERRLNFWAVNRKRMNYQNMKYARISGLRSNTQWLDEWEKEEKEVLAQMERGRDPFGRNPFGRDKPSHKGVFPF